MGKPWEKYQKQNEGPWTKYQNVEQDKPKESKSALGTALDLGFRILDYPAGFIRTGLAEVGDAFVDGNKVTGEDWKNTLYVKAPTSAELIKKLGFGNQNDTPDILRGTGGFALDIATDPLTYLSLGTLPVLKNAHKSVNLGLNFLSQPFRTTFQPVAKSIYKSTFNKADEVSKQFNKTPISEIAWKNNIKGTQRGINKKLNARANFLSTQADEILDKAAQAGAKTDFYGAFLDVQKNSRKNLDNLDVLKNKSLKKGNKLINDMISKASPEEILGGIDVKRANELKRSFYNNMPKKTYGGFAGTDAGLNHIKNISRSLKEGVETGVERVSPSLKKSLKETNDELGGIVTAIKSLENSADIAGRKNLISEIDALSFMHSPATLGLKQTVKAGNTPFARTYGGKALYKSMPYSDILLRSTMREAD